MTSIMTNASAMTALQSLQATNKALESTQSRISTGYRVASAADNAAYWSIATTMRSDNKALSTVQDALGLGAAKVDTAYTGMNSAIEVVDEIKKKLVAAREGGVDKAKIQAEISTLQEQLKSNAAAASFSGENWLAVKSDDGNYSATKEIVSSFTRSASSVSVGTIDIDLSSVVLFDAAVNTATGGIGILDAHYTGAVTGTPPTIGGVREADQSTPGTGAFTVTTLDIGALTNSAFDIAKIDSFIIGVDDTITRMTNAASDLGAAKKRVDLQKDFVKNLMDTIERGIGNLVDADMNQESTRLQALQVQQQLGIQALSIANSSAQGVLSLFRS
ncbi:flagellin [Tianweitania sediminis]|uniref:Flagellin n=1 Tax=Tianweitania sediminis TaxID=1502156 RepID=A0A8J7UJP1_9HYPH|nr:flagellin [Tianweitania sediminis]MBP0438839.1 flagellin [Tianweitania sediminis]